MIGNFKLEGKIVPSEVTVGILQQAMQQSENKKFIIDGFPRNEENLATFEKTVKVEPEFVLFFDCPEEELKRRLLNRNQVSLILFDAAGFTMEASPNRSFSFLLQGRADDNPVTIEKRLKVFKESTLPVINYYSSKGKVQKINAQRSVEQVFDDIRNVFSKLNPGSRLRFNKKHPGLTLIFLLLLLSFNSSL
ncbi:hypothetical protein OIU84_028313 [Salix udensis]|uniref:adenylate kinase n=1 Tax=Salix udensis TaxID=889485 RepID=A0AAD6KCA3_9ROSI|nr:hypothetical protein OIU84_028313 [Salix udensis]